MLGWGRSSRTPFAKTRKSWRTTGRTRAASRGTRSRRPHATHSSMPRGMAALPRTRQTLGMRLHCIRGLPGAGPRFHAHSALQAGCRLSLPHELAWRYSRDSSAATRLGSTFELSGGRRYPGERPLERMVGPSHSVVARLVWNFHRNGAFRVLSSKSVMRLGSKHAARPRARGY